MREVVSPETGGSGSKGRQCAWGQEEWPLCSALPADSGSPWVSPGPSVELAFPKAAEPRDRRAGGAEGSRKGETLTSEQWALLALTRMPSQRENPRAKLSGTWGPLLRLIFPLKVLLFFGIITLVLIQLCIHLIRGIFFNNCVSHARHSHGDKTGPCSSMGSSDLQALSQ